MSSMAVSGNFDDMKILLSRHGGHLLNSWSNCNSITWYKFAINCEPLWLSMVSDKSHASKMHAWLDIYECNSANRRVDENHFKGIVKPNRSKNFLWNNGKILMCYEDVSMCLKPWTRSWCKWVNLRTIISDLRQNVLHSVCFHFNQDLEPAVSGDNVPTCCSYSVSNS